MADTPDKDSVNSVHKGDQSKKEGQETPPVLRAELQIPHSIIDTYQTNQKAKNRLERWKFRVEVATLIVIAIYTAVAYHQWRTMLDATEATKKSAEAAQGTVEMMRRDQRAWVGPNEIMPAQFKDASGNPIYIKEKGIPRLGVFIINSGKSPALKVEANINCFFQPTSTALSPSYSRAISSVTVLQPQMRTALTITTSPFDDSAIKTMKNGTFTLYVFGKITYEDIFGMPHRTTFCMSLVPSLDYFTSCEAYNDAN